VNNSLQVKDELRGIGVIYKIYSTRFATIYYIDVNTILKGVEPHWHGFNQYKNGSFDWELVWLDPRFQFLPIEKKRTTRIKSASIYFGSRFRGWDMAHSMSRYSCVVVFFHHKLLRGAIKRKPVYEEK